MQYYKGYSQEEINNAINGSVDDWNRFNDKYHYATCSACHREYLYSKESPILKDHLWEKVKKYFGLIENIEPRYAEFYNIKDRQMSRLKTIKYVMPDKCHCTICDKCMEKALGHKIQRNDLIQCKMSNNYIKENCL